MKRLIFLIIFSTLSAKEIPYTLEDRDRLLRIEVMLKEFQIRVDKQFESIEKRFESIEKRFDQLIEIMIGIVIAFAGIVAVTIGFAIWDRRSMIKLVETKLKETTEMIEEIDKTKIKNLIEILREIAKYDAKVADALKKFNFM
jgi:hypothetical protein